jgi:hypothetical protein
LSSPPEQWSRANEIIANLDSREAVCNPILVPDAGARCEMRLPRDCRPSSNFWGMTIIVSGTLHVEPEQREAFLAARVPIIAHAGRAPGCIDF